MINIIIWSFRCYFDVIYGLFLITGHAPGHGFGHLPQDPGGGVRGAAQEVAEPVLLRLQRLAKLHKLLLDGLGVPLLVLGQGLPEPVQDRDADLAVAGLERDRDGCEQ